MLEKIEKAKTFPEFFNPEIFREVVRWTKSETGAQSLHNVGEMVGSQAKSLVKNAS